MGRNYSQLSLEERCAIARLYENGQSIRQIASALDRSASTISRELRRNMGSLSTGYLPSYADDMAWARRWRGSRLERHSALQHYVLDRLAMGWSPEQVSGRMRLEKHSSSLSHESIYRFIYAQIARTKDYRWRLYLPRAKSKRGYRGRKGGSSVQNLKHRVSIHKRPDIINKREETGHWETDLMMFSDKKSNLLVMQERQSRFVKLALQKDKKSTRISNRLKGWFMKMPKAMKRSLTQDNGTEFALHHRLHKMGIQTYFCDPKAPWQKGGVENMNARLRRYLPLKTNCKTVTKQDIIMLEKQMNTTPRKCLGYKTPLEVFNKTLHFKCESTFLFSKE